jgi:2-keto-4-pentenoate hydratase/2-oxohepta-3-ene-1,7-dioic acid hydratase in catechol pathway
MLSHSKRASAISLAMGLNVLFLTAGMGQGKVTRYLRFRAGKTVAYGILEGDVVHQLKGNLFGKWERTEKTHPLKEVRILVPSPRPTKVIALAGNYKDHLGDKEPPKTPEPFFKLPSSLLRHGGRIIQPKDHAPVHYEAELVVVIGKRARNVTPEQALDFVLGITCGNDISARDWQQNDVQWWRAKGSDTFGPVGPYIVSGLDYNNLAMELRVNGEVRQKTNTKNQIHDLATTISFISKRITLRPGDLIFTGTPGKTQGMEIGDSVEVEIQGVGILKNKLVAEK